MVTVKYIMEQFSTRLCILLKTRGIGSDSETLSKKLGISKTTLSKYRNGWSEPRLITIQTFVTALKLNRDELWFLVMGNDPESHNDMIEHVGYDEAQCGREK